MRAMRESGNRDVCCNVQRPRETDRRTATRESTTSREKTATLKKSSN
jgi:hypothetical protein